MSYDTTLPIQMFIGYDPDEHRAYEVCKSSIKHPPVIRDINPWARSIFDDSSVVVKRLYTKDIPGWYREREEHQSTDFTYTRFLAPYLCGYKGVSIFCDCDFVFLADPQELVDKYFDSKYAVQVVQHPAYVPKSQIKMDGRTQHTMPKKNWASLIMFNNEHPKNKQLTFDYVNSHMPGRDLHQFKWLDDEDIGALPLEWNCLDGYYLMENPKAIHYTDGGPWFEHYKDTMYSDRWYEAERVMKSKKATNEI